jgi:hypothetical protein
MSKGASDGAPAVWVAVSLPCAPQFVATLGDLSSWIAAYAGYDAADARRICEAAEAAASCLIRMGDSRPGETRMEAAFETGAGSFAIRLSHEDAWQEGSDFRPMPPESVAARPDEAERMRRGMDSVEFGERQGHGAFCRMQRELPG